MVEAMVIKNKHRTMCVTMVDITPLRTNKQTNKHACLNDRNNISKNKWKNTRIVVAKAMSTSRNKQTSMHIMMVEVIFLEQTNKHAMAKALTF
jgi:hypothetical protein